MYFTTTTTTTTAAATTTAVLLLLYYCYDNYICHYSQDPYIYHYTFGVEYNLDGSPVVGGKGAWSLDKRNYYGQALTLTQTLALALALAPTRTPTPTLTLALSLALTMARRRPSCSLRRPTARSSARGSGGASSTRLPPTSARSG